MLSEAEKNDYCGNINMNSAFERTSRVDLTLHLSQLTCAIERNAEERVTEETMLHVPATGLRTSQKLREENRTACDLNEVVSVGPSAAHRTSLDPAVTVQTPLMRK